MTIKIGDILGGKYKLKQLRGKGGMGAVYEADHVVLGKAFAIKLLHPHYAMQPEVFKRFQLEAQAAAGIGHRGIVDVYDIGQTDDGSPFLVMELLRGESLAELLERKKQLDILVAVEIVAQTLSALVAVHKKKILHRDLKPENVFLCQEDDQSWFIKILDFGISKVTGPEAMNLTMTGSILGTAHYMSPEQARGAKDVDIRADIWAVGAILYRALAGRLPFEGDSYNEVLAKILSDPVIPPRTWRPEIPETLDLLMLHALSKDRDERYSSAADFLEDLEEFRPERGHEASPWDGPIPGLDEDDKETKAPAGVRSSQDVYRDIEDSKQTAAFDLDSMDGHDRVLEDSKSTTPMPVAVNGSRSVIPETCMIQTEHWRNPTPPWDKPPPGPPDTFDAAVRPISRFSRPQQFVLIAVVVLSIGAVLGIGWAAWPTQNDDEGEETFGIVAAAQPEPSGDGDESPERRSTAEAITPVAASLSPASVGLVADSVPSTQESSEEEESTAQEPSKTPPSRRAKRPRSLTTREIDTALRSRQSGLRRCLGLSSPAPTLVRVRIRISGTGAVSYENAQPTPPLNVSSCLREAVRGARVGSGGTEPTTHLVSVRSALRPQPTKRNGPLWDSPFSR